MDSLTLQRNYHREQCSSSFSQLSVFEFHLQTHTEETPHCCNRCGRHFSSRGLHRKHLCNHTGSYQCDQCEKRFTLLSSYKDHQRVHTREKPYQCDQCERGFSRLSNYKTHQRVHTGEKPHHCGQCGKSFRFLCDYKRHLRIHTGEKPHCCEQCGKGFSCTSHYKRHLLVHSGEKPYQCDHCGKQFTESSDYNRHLRTHTGEKPYQCEQCGKRFSHLSSYNEHLRCHNGEKPYWCSQCKRLFAWPKSLKVHRCVDVDEERLSVGVKMCLFPVRSILAESTTPVLDLDVYLSMEDSQENDVAKVTNFTVPCCCVEMYSLSAQLEIRMLECQINQE